MLLVILLIALGFSQTSTFREYLRSTVVNLANKNLHGHVSIGKIDGTIFTSLYIRNSVVNMASDTLLNAETIAVKVSPLQILGKRIYVRNIEIRNAKIDFTSDSAGVLNISKLFPSTPPDSTHSKFPFKIVAADVELENVDFTMQRFDKIGSEENYNNLNLNDLRVKNLNLSLSGQADIANNNFEANIKKLSFSPNLVNFDLKELSGKFFVNEKGIDVDGLKLITANSNINLSVKAEGMNIFDTVSVEKLEKAKLSVNLDADKFNFDDLSTFVSSTNILKGTVDAEVRASGNLKELNLERLEVNYLNTHLEAKGKIREVLEPDDIYIDASFSKSAVNAPDIAKLLPSIKIPSLSSNVINIDTLNYHGNPENFTTVLFARNGKGTVDLKASLDLRKKDMSYDVSYAAQDFDLSPFIGFPVSLNARGIIKGSGLDPENMNSTIRMYGGGSVVQGNILDTLRIFADAANKKISYNIKVEYDTSKADFTGSFDFTHKEKPAYDLSGNVKNLNLADFIQDSTMQSNLNFSVDASGDNFDLDKTDLYLSLELNNSNFRGNSLDKVRAIADIRSNDKGERIINIVSDLADVTVEGNFSVKQTINMLSSESGLLAKEFKYKFNEIFQPQNNFDKQVQTGVSVPVSNQQSASYTSSKLSYQIEFKNFDFISAFLKNNHVSIKGSLSGKIENNSDSIFVSLNSSFDYIKYWNDQDVYFTTGLNINTDVSNNFNAQSLRNVNSDFSIKADRIYAGSDIHDLSLKLKLLDDAASLNFSAKVKDNINFHLAGKIDFMGNILHADFDSLLMAYNQFTLRNDKRMTILYSQDRIDVKNFELVKDGSKIDIEGFLARAGNQNLTINISNMGGFDVGTNLFGLNPENDIDANLNLSADITGNFSEPVIKLNFDADTVSFKDQVFGSLISNFYYADKNLNVDVKFLDSTLEKSNPELLLTGNLPVDLAFTGAEERLIKSEPMNIKLLAQKFNLSSLGNSIPSISKLKGILNADLKVSGTPGEPIFLGQLEINDADFFADANNLEYNAGLKISVNNHSLLLDSLFIANSPQTLNGGTIRGSGKATLNNLNIASSEFRINGDLKVLSEESKYVSPAVYGELVIATNGDIQFTADSKGEYLQAPIIIKNADLTFPPVQSAYQNSSSNFIYKFASDTATEKKSQLEIENLVRLSKQRSQIKKTLASKKSTFDYSIDVSVQKEATLRFVISKELDQNLTALLKGNFQYQMIGGRSNAQGELTLLEGSTLEFLKTFDAAGTIRFESELSNPYLNVVATYKNYYTPPTSDAKEEQVAVKIRLKGPLKDLSKSFLQDQNNISVYVGTDNINNDAPDRTKDENDALMFILQGQFASDLTAQQQSSAIKQAGLVTGAATSLAGSMLGGLLNRYFGDYVKGLDLRSVGSTTKFNLVGKVKDFKYTIGGSTDVFQDLSQANIKIEYPIYKSLLLRLERKQAITQTTISNEMVNELGLQYKFEF